MKTGIYKITNNINRHSYIGMSIDIEKRWNDHKSKAFNSKQENIDKVLYKAIRKHGVENFSIETLEECSQEKMVEREIYWIKHFNTYNDKKHYNMTPGGDMPGYNTVHIGEEHGMSILTEEEVIDCRNRYSRGERSRTVYEEFFSERMKYSGFLRMWHGNTWKHIMPEVFENNPHKASYSESDCKVINKLFEESNLSLSAFTKTDECFVGYGTAWRMVNEPTFYKGKR